MKTHESQCNPAVTMTVSVHEAMMLWQALDHYDRMHRKLPRDPKAKPDGKWGRFDCPPRIQPLLGVIKCSIHDEAPELFETCFGFPPQDKGPNVHDPLPNREDPKAELTNA